MEQDAEIAESIGENVENAGGSVIQIGGEQVAVRAAGRVQSVAVRLVKLTHTGRRWAIAVLCAYRTSASVSS